MHKKLLVESSLVILVSGLISGCGYMFGDKGLFPSRSSDYLKAKESPQLDVPADMELKPADELYQIPDLRFANVLPEKYEAPRIESLENVQSRGSITVQRFLDDQWILVKRSPSQTWPLVTQFLNSNDISLAVTETEQGLIETDWLTVEPSENGETIPNERYRFLLKSGVQQNTTEVFVKQRTGNDGLPLDEAWKKSTSVDRENKMVVLLAEYLADSPGSGSHSLLAQGIGSASKVGLRYHADGSPYVELQLPYDRGWASIQLALTKSGFTLNDRDQSKGVYWVYGDFSGQKKSKKKGLFSRLFSSGDKMPEKDPLKSYQVHVDSSSEPLQISIQRSGDPELRPNEQAFLLRKVMNALS